jgi:hypothetical protein
MDATTVRQSPAHSQQPTRDDLVLRELRALRQEQAALRRLFDEFAGAFLNARFPYGRPVDRWARRG